MRQLFILLLLLLLSSCGIECNTERDNLCIISRFGSEVLSIDDVLTAFYVVENEYPNVKSYRAYNLVPIYFEPYRDDGLYGWFISKENTIHIRYVDRCVSSQTLVHETLHLAQYLNHVDMKTADEDKELFYSKYAKEYTLFESVFNDCEVE